jgi:hypothetical protein
MELLAGLDGDGCNFWCTVYAFNNILTLDIAFSSTVFPRSLLLSSRLSCYQTVPRLPNSSVKKTDAISSPFEWLK